MHNVNTLRRILGLVCLGLLLLTSLGCNKMLAKYSLSRAQKRLEEAKVNEAQRFASDLLDKTNAAINTAQGRYSSQNFTEARDQAKIAAQLSQDLLDHTKSERARSLKNEAYLWIDRAKKNQGQTIDNVRFTQIQTDNETGLKQVEKASYDKAIKTFLKVIDDVQYLLRNLEVSAKEGLAETKRMREDLIKEGAQEHAPEYVEELNQFIDKIKSLIEKEYNYRTAISTRDQARQKKQEGIQQTKSVKSYKQLEEIENLLKVATDLGAEEYALQNWHMITKDYQNLLTQFYSKNYDTVLVSAPELKPRVEKLIVETKRESANARKQAVEKAINALVDAKARNYLPGRIEQLESLLQEANARFKEAKYEDSEAVSKRALELNQNIIQEFDTLTQKEIGKAKDSLATADNVYTTMENIFDKQSPGALTGEDKALEDSKQALKKELKSKLTNSRLSLGMAVLKREEKDFDLAIETAKQVAQAAEDVRQQTYRVVAHNAILEIANQLTFLERSGGRQYAASETNKTLTLLEESKKMLHDGQYREAVRRAADTKAQLEILNQELERVAVKKIEQARSALNQAKENRAERYQNDTFNQAIVSLDKASASLEGEGLQQAIESARQAESLAASASQKSLQKWSEDEMRHADILLGKARVAGAQRYAPEQLQKAADLRKNLQQLYDQQSYKQSIEVGEQSVEAANAALYAKVIEAENAIATAKRFDGWQQEPQRLAEAIVSAKNARQAMDDGQYRTSLQHAQSSITVAAAVAHDAKREAFESRMSDLQKRLEVAQREGAGYYQSKDLSKILSEMNGLRNEFNGKSYEDLAQKIELLESQLGGVMEMTPDVLKDLMGTMQTRLQDLEKRGAKTYVTDKVEAVEQKMKYAQIDFKANKFRPSFENARAASKTLDAIELNLDEHDFDQALNKQMEAFAEQMHKFGPVLDLGSPAVIQLAIGPQGKANALTLMQATSPSDLRTAITEIGANVRMLKPPATRVEVHQTAIKMLILAKTSASNFEKMLILDQYSTKQAREIIETAFLQMYQARSQQKDVQNALQYPQTQLVPKGVERVDTYQGS